MPIRPAALAYDKLQEPLLRESRLSGSPCEHMYDRNESAKLNRDLARVDVRYLHLGLGICRSGSSNIADIPLDFVRNPSIGVVTESRRARGRCLP